MENIFEKGCLVQLSVSQWGAARKIDKSKLAEMVSSPDWVRATKKLVDPESLKPVSKITNEARSYLTGVSLPFPIKGLVFIPKDLISRVDERLQDFKDRFDREVETFLGDYHYLRSLARIYLGELFNELDYPVDIRRKFSFSWRFVILDVPDGQMGVLSPEVYEREKAKFVKTMEEARELAVLSLREEFASMVDRITERFGNGPDGKPKVFKNTTVTGFYEFFETFKERNIFRDAELAELVEQAKSILGGESAEKIRSNDHVKERIRSRMEEVESAMADIFERPRRKIVIG
ncbi:MAG: DUF3150 domain-containing protein [Spirochaetia bacterium]